MKRLDTHALACLEVLVAEQHVSRAAYRMGISQPAMSEMLSRLREIFDDPLLVRSRRGMAATPRAVAVAVKARDVLHLLEEALSGDNRAGPPDAGREIRIRVLTSLAFNLLPHLVSRLQTEAPNTTVSIQQADVRQTPDLLENNECDVAIGIPPTVSPSLHVSRLLPNDLCCIVRADHPGIGATLSVRDFVAYPHVVLSGGPVPVSTIEMAIDHKLRAMKLTRRIGVRVPDLLVSPGIVAETDFIATVPQRVVRHFAARSQLRILRLPFTLAVPHILMVWHERTHRDPLHRRVRRIIRAVARQVDQAAPTTLAGTASPD